MHDVNFKTIAALHAQRIYIYPIYTYNLHSYLDVLYTDIVIILLNNIRKT